MREWEWVIVGTCVCHPLGAQGDCEILQVVREEDMSGGERPCGNDGCIRHCGRHSTSQEDTHLCKKPDHLHYSCGHSLCCL